jgi:hypothetical protein
VWEGFTIPLIIQKVQIINIVTKALSCGKEYLSWQSNVVTLYAGRYLTDEIRTGGDNKVFNNFVHTISTGRRHISDFLYIPLTRWQQHDFTVDRNLNLDYSDS